MPKWYEVVKRLGTPNLDWQLRARDSWVMEYQKSSVKSQVDSFPNVNQCSSREQTLDSWSTRSVLFIWPLSSVCCICQAQYVISVLHKIGIVLKSIRTASCFHRSERQSPILAIFFSYEESINLTEKSINVFPRCRDYHIPITVL